MGTLYKGLYEPITTNGWSDLLNGKTSRMLIRSHRMVLLQVTKACRTISTEALQVIAGVISIDLLVEVRARDYKKRKGRDEASNERTIVREAIEKWQERWQKTPKGRTTFEFFDSINRQI